MLTMLKIVPQRKYPFPVSVIKKLLPRRTDGYMRRVGYSPYIEICCELKNGSPDWRSVCANTLDSSGRILMPRGIECPGQYGLSRFRPTRFLRQMYSNLAVETLLETDIPPHDRTIAICGREAETAMLLPRIAPLCGAVKMLTSRPDAISKEASRLEEQTGLPIIISDDYDASGYTMLLAPSGGAAAINCADTLLVISPDRPDSGYTVWVKSVKISVPQQLEEIYTEEYDLLETVGAFCESAGMEILGRISPDAIVEDGQVLPPSELAALCSVQRRSGQSS